VGRSRQVTTLDTAGLDARLRPRDDQLVLEVADGGTGAPGERGERVFTGIEGPFRSYERRVAWAPAEAGHRVEESATWHLAFPYWRRLYEPLIRRSVLRPLPRGARTDLVPRGQASESASGPARESPTLLSNRPA